MEIASKKKIKLPQWSKSFAYQIIIALALGTVLGLIAKNSFATEDNWLSNTLQIVGTKYISLLQIVIPPLIFTAVIASIANLSKLNNAARLAGQTVLWFAITAFFSVCIGLAVGLLANPGKNTTVDSDIASTSSTQGSWWGFLEQILPSNFLGLNARTRIETSDTANLATTTINFNILQILLISIVVGIAALHVGKKAKIFLDLNETILAIIQKILWWIIRLVPLGTLALVGNAVASKGWNSLGKLAIFAIAIHIALSIVLFVLYPILLKINGLSIKNYYLGVWPALQLAFVSRSSMGTMPLTQKLVEKNLGVPKAYTSFAVPLAATTKMDGCASIYPAIASIFVAQFYGIDLDWKHYLLIIFVSVLGSTATAGTTGAMVMLTLTLSTLGLPLEGVGLLLAVDPIIDMSRTTVNVAGQALIPVIVAKREKILDEKIYNSKKNGINNIANRE